MPNGKIGVKTKKWLGKTINYIFSTSFSLYENQKLDLNQTQAYCSENLILALTYFYREKNLDSKEIQMVEEFIN